MVPGDPRFAARSPRSWHEPGNAIRPRFQRGAGGERFSPGASPMIDLDARRRVTPCLLLPLFGLLAACSGGQDPAASDNHPAAVRPSVMPASVPSTYAATPHGFF